MPTKQGDKTRSPSAGNRSRRENDAVRSRQRDDTNANADERKILDRGGDLLSRTTHRARWIHNGDEHEARKGQTLATRSHDVIKAWAEERGAKPATVPGTEHDSRRGVLRFVFDTNDPGRLDVIGWKDWFKTFDERDLIFLFQEHLRNGNQSNFFRFDSPKREDA